MIRREDDGLWLELSETIAAHHDLVFDCLTTSVGLSRWYPLAAEVDLRTGGSIVFGWDEKMRQKSTLAILNYDSGGEIVWDWYLPYQDTHAPIYWNVQPSREAGAIITMRQGPYKQDTESLMAMVDEATHWQWHLCNLRAVLEVKHDMRSHRPL